MGECQWRGAAVADSRKGLTAQPTPSRRRQKPHRMQLISRVVRTRRSRPALPRSAAGTSLSWGPAQRICPSACRPFARAHLAAAVRQTTALAPHHNSIPSQACPLGPTLPLAPALPSAPALNWLRKHKRPLAGLEADPAGAQCAAGSAGFLLVRIQPRAGIRRYLSRSPTLSCWAPSAPRRLCRPRAVLKQRARNIFFSDVRYTLSTFHAFLPASSIQGNR